MTTYAFRSFILVDGALNPTKDLVHVEFNSDADAIRHAMLLGYDHVWNMGTNRLIHRPGYIAEDKNVP